jgi:DNA invertase Pin-like site-specific DNA recombinase
MPARRVAIYLRVSTDEQTTENQRRELAEVATRSGWHIVDIYEDAGISGANGREKRPAFDRLLKDAARREFDMVAARSIPAPASGGHHHASRSGAIPDARRVRRI